MPVFQHVVFIGAGNVATQMAYALEQSGKQIVQIYSRSESSARKLADDLYTDFTTDISKIEKKADLYIMAVTDEAAFELAGKLKLIDRPVVHTSGSLPLDLLRDVSVNRGVLYPLQTFSKKRKVCFASIPMFVEASSPSLLESIKVLASEISGHVFEVNSERRKILHLAGVFACNFPNYMYTIAGQLVLESGFDFEILRPLIKETADKVMNENPQDVQTGPAIRGDVRVLEMHLDWLKDKPDIREIYSRVSHEIAKMQDEKTDNHKTL